MQMKALFVLLLIIVMSICCQPAAAVWIDKGSQFKSSADGGGGADEFIYVSQNAHYYYNPDTNQWRIDLTVSGTARKFSWSQYTWGWRDAYGSYGVYISDSGYWGTSDRYGDEKVWYTSTIVAHKQMKGTNTVYSGSYYYTPSSPSASISVGVVGSCVSKGAQAWTWK